MVKMIQNKTKQTLLAKDHKVCVGLWSKAKGLMFSKKRSLQGRGLVFEFSREQRLSMHMMFVFYPIDVLFLDEKRKVSEIKERFLPFTFLTSKEKSRYVLELPSGKVRETNTKTGDAIEWGEL